MAGPWTREKESAAYADGRTAALHDVRVTITNAGISIRGDEVEAWWSAEGLEVVDAPANEKALRLAHRDHDGSRLQLQGPAYVGRIERDLPDLLARRSDSRRYDLRKLAIAGGSVGVLVGLFFLFLPAIVSGVAAAIPDSVERRMGERAMNTFARFFDGADIRCSSTEGQKALDWMVVQLMDGAELDADVDIRVVPVDIVNAVAFPGGKVLIFDGLIQQAGSAEEVAGVVAHEMGHVARHHGMEQLVRDSAIGAVLSVFSPGSAGDIGGELGAALITQSYGRDAEREADDFAIGTLNNIGVTTQGMADFFGRVAEEREGDSGGGALLQYLASHPAPEERADAIARRGTGDGRILDDAEWRALKRICGGN